MVELGSSSRRRGGAQELPEEAEGEFGSSCGICAGAQPCVRRRSKELGKESLELGPHGDGARSMDLGLGAWLWSWEPPRTGDRAGRGRGSPERGAGPRGVDRSYGAGAGRVGSERDSMAKGAEEPGRTKKSAFVPDLTRRSGLLVPNKKRPRAEAEGELGSAQSRAGALCHEELVAEA